MGKDGEEAWYGIQQINRTVVVLDNNKLKVMINPEIVGVFGDLCFMEEGCLSIPEVFLNIKRPNTIKVKYRDMKGKPNFKIYSGLTARIIQHEIDHLDGIVMVNK
jgi:peptide deformylase